MNPRHIVVGTAGHIDHGKSTLVHALTGVDPDRLKEEKSRGITIELGFADLVLDDHRTVSFVDVPGHERFVRHMVAGATGIDGVMLVVAADEGVRPQTREHLDICELLALRHGFVVLTKADLVDEDLLEVVRLELEETLAGSFLAGAPIVTASAVRETGLDDVRAALVDLCDTVPIRREGGVPRLPVDRTFVLKGFGTVVTGTLVSGTLREGMEVEISPGGRTTRIRGLQVHGRKVEVAPAGRRTAVNLQGVSTEQAPRGSTLTSPGALRTTRRLWARLTLLPSAPDAMRRGGPVRFHQGTTERAARFRVLRDADDGDFDVELFLESEVPLVPGDRFVVRRPAPLDTVGGGVVLDIAPPITRRGRADELALLETDSRDAVAIRLRRAAEGGLAAAALGAELGAAVPEIEAQLQALADRGRAVALAGTWFDAAALEQISEALADYLASFHRAEPLQPGVSRERIRSEKFPGIAGDAWRAFLEREEVAGRLARVGERLALPSHEVVLSELERASIERLETRIREAGLDPSPTDDLVAAESGVAARKLLDLLVERGDVVRLRDGRLVHGAAMEAVYAGLREHAGMSRRIDVAAFKQRFGVTRKNAIPLLEFLDEARKTRRVGNEREILNV